MQLDSLIYETTTAPKETDVAAVDAGLTLFNHAAAPLDGVVPLVCFARLNDGNLIGGAIARTWGECCEVRQLWVDEDHRGCGIGRRLIQEVESEARRRGCTLIYLETFSFQSPKPYQDLEFETRCEFSGFPAQITKYIMAKVLT